MEPLDYLLLISARHIVFAAIMAFAGLVGLSLGPLGLLEAKQADEAEGMAGRDPAGGDEREEEA